jgi:hypothetical protein
MTARTRLSEPEAVNIVRNALLVAGQEMGAEGDHWPVIKKTIHDVVQTYENLQVERRVHEELRRHLMGDLIKMENILKKCSVEERTILEPKLFELRGIYEAYFTDINEEELELVDLPPHLQRAEAIMKTLEAEDE